MTYHKAAHSSLDILSNGLNISNALQEKRRGETLGVKLSELNQSTIQFGNIYPELHTDHPIEKKMKQMIAEFAIFANTFVGEYLKLHMNGRGIFRTCIAKEWLNTVSTEISGENLLNEIIINGIQADYISSNLSHDLVGSPEYCHFTSPIRRMADCVCHYLLKYVFLLNKQPSLEPPFSNYELEGLSKKCLQVTKQVKKIQYQDIKFRLIQCMSGLLTTHKSICITYFVTSYTGLFLNIIICKINDFNVHLSYVLRIKNYKEDIHKEKYTIHITTINPPHKFDEGTIPELDQFFKK